MKRLGLSVLVLLALAAGLWSGRTVKVEAQTLPVTKTFAWDANPAGDAVTAYHPALDGVSLGTTTNTSVPFTITSAGPHTLTVTAENLWGISPVATLNFVVVVPSRPANPRIQ